MNVTELNNVSRTCEPTRSGETPLPSAIEIQFGANVGLDLDGFIDVEFDNGRYKPFSWNPPPLYLFNTTYVLSSSCIANHGGDISAVSTPSGSIKCRGQYEESSYGCE